MGKLRLQGRHRFLIGDCTVKENVDRLMDGEKADMVFTSPPYNQKLETFKKSGMHSSSKFIDRMAGAYCDSLPEDEYQQQQIDLINSIHNHATTDIASFFYNHKVRYRNKEVQTPYSWLVKSDWKIRQEIVWDRGGSITLNARMFMPCDERIYWLTKGEFLFNDTPEIKAWSSVWRIAPVNEIKNVSAPFPNELALRGIAACSAPGDLVLEPYCGTGTVLIAADKLNRRCYGMEIEPLYGDVILSRFTTYSGKRAVREDGVEWVS